MKDATEVRSRRTSQTSLLGLMRDGRGAVMVEYVVLLGTVTIAFAAAILGLGPSLIANYEKSQGTLLSPFP